MTTEAEIRAAKQHTTFATTTYGERTLHSLRYIKTHPYETIVGDMFTSKKALKAFAAKHGLTIAYWN